MNKFYFILILLLLGCGTRKKTTDTYKDFKKDFSQVENSAKGEATTKRITENSENSTYKLNADNLDFSVKSLNGLPVYFDFVSNGQKFRAETNGEINFSSEKKHEEKAFEKKEKVVEIVHTTYKTQTTYKTIITQKESESKRPSFAWFILAFLLGLAVIPTIKIILKK